MFARLFGRKKATKDSWHDGEEAGEVGQGVPHDAADRGTIEDVDSPLPEANASLELSEHTVDKPLSRRKRSKRRPEELHILANEDGQDLLWTVSVDGAVPVHAVPPGEPVTSFTDQDRRLMTEKRIFGSMPESAFRRALGGISMRVNNSSSSVAIRARAKTRSKSAIGAK